MFRRGFTLIELLIVVAVIAVLAAILLPVFGRAKEEGHVASDLNKLHQLAVANSLYQQTWGDGVGSCIDLVDSGLIPKEVCSSPRDFVPEGLVQLFPQSSDPGYRVSFVGRREGFPASRLQNKPQRLRFDAMTRNCGPIARFVDLLDVPRSCGDGPRDAPCHRDEDRFVHLAAGMKAGSPVRRVFDDGSVRTSSLHEIWIVWDGVQRWGGELVGDAPWAEDCDWQSIADESPQL